MNVNFSIAIIIACIQLLIGNVTSENLEGSSVRGLNSRIIGGTRANSTRYPYYTYLRLFYQSGDVSFCGGSLVNSDVVLSAAHCIASDDDKLVKIKVYVNYTQSIAVTWNLTEYVYERDAISWITHPKFGLPVNFNYPNDVGLIFLDKTVLDVATVRLNKDADLPPDRDSVTAIGHGYVIDGETPGFPYYLNEVTVPVVPFEDCSDSNLYGGLVHDKSMICAGFSSGWKGYMHW